MRIYVFKSEANEELRAFASDLAGATLPDQFRPWHAIGVIGPDKDPPHNLPREEIETAINLRGFQLWRLKPNRQEGLAAADRIASGRPARRSNRRPV